MSLTRAITRPPRDVVERVMASGLAVRCSAQATSSDDGVKNTSAPAPKSAA
jgi:hypothetical protein